MQRDRWQRLPQGTRDWLSHETSRLRAAQDGVLREAARWGYREVTTPTLEYLDVLVRGEGAETGDRLFKLIDRSGELLALRPEMTTPVARLAAGRLRDEPLPLRLSYAGQVFRGQEAGSGRLREFPQVGCELIGSGTSDADAEIVALAVAALQAAGVGRFSLSLGHVGYLRGVLDGLGLTEAAAVDVRALLYQKDFVGLRELLERHGVPSRGADALAALPSLRGPDALARAGRFVDTPEVRGVIRDLTDLGGMLSAYGVAGAVTVDLSIIRDFDYYTGIVFEGHTPALGSPLLGGGRYDRLLERYGLAHPATGFALRVDRILAAAEEEGAPGRAPAPDVVVAFAEGCRDQALAWVRALRGRGLTVVVEVSGRSWDDVAREAQALGIPRAALVRPDGVLVRDAGGREILTRSGDLVAADPRTGTPR